MKVILQADVKGHGKKGDLVNASDGYAKNYLIPKGLAVLADKTTINELENRKSSEQFHKNQEELHAKQLAEKLEGSKIKFQIKAGDNGKLFGSITAKDIAEQIKMQLHVEIDKKKVVLPDSIKTLGSTEVVIKVYANIAAKITVEVLPL
ncbi:MULTISPECIES: 50S ribosomal protein L9 [Congzhengia]|jgi:large subunit ribosomal protein L9|uniref:Large ribosomal subunit protein bL9 n=1 Tax=Congzhengia minquanensis TaxID=2763657 RepID=A0A926DM18_9FIRM|nr:50S ribosomal protein L9 [Congzhengia minquanensis]MBC8540478.1 50S ribosomal protein L9 [Congzhengia minquanensis]MBD8946867.1 50S ribosomal protein L9 [Clostridiales bacterium]HBL81257.1 50S ribosomal protein L9 [Clostridiales bacterium]